MTKTNRTLVLPNPQFINQWTPILAQDTQPVETKWSKCIASKKCPSLRVAFGWVDFSRIFGRFLYVVLVVCLIDSDPFVLFVDFSRIFGSTNNLKKGSSEGKVKFIQNIFTMKCYKLMKLKSQCKLFQFVFCASLSTLAVVLL